MVRPAAAPAVSAGPRVVAAVAAALAAPPGGKVRVGGVAQHGRALLVRQAPQGTQRAQP